MVKENKSNNKELNIVLFYIIVGFTRIIIFPTIGIIAVSFVLTGVIIPIVGLINLIGYIFNIDISFIMFQIGNLALNPILGFLLSIIVGIFLYIIGKYAWKLLLTYISIVKDKKQKFK